MTEAAVPKGTLEEILLEAAEEGRLPCSAAFRVSFGTGRSLAEIGEAADRLGLKISACQLGCFP